MLRAFYEKSEYVKPTLDEIFYSIKHGNRKEDYSVAHGLKNKHGCNFTPKQSRFNTILSDITEAASAIAFGWPIKLTNATYNVPDLDGNIQVKSIKDDRWGLMIRDDVPNDCRVMGVIVDLCGWVDWRDKNVDPDFFIKNPTFFREPFRLPGWITAIEARQLSRLPKNDDWRTNFGNGREYVTMVPQEALHPLSELREILEREGLKTNNDRLIKPL